VPPFLQRAGGLKGNTKGLAKASSAGRFRKYRRRRIFLLKKIKDRGVKRKEMNLDTFLRDRKCIPEAIRGTDKNRAKSRGKQERDSSFFLHR